MAASGVTDIEANKLLDFSIDAGSVVDLVTTMGTATAPPTKVAGGSYAPQTPTFDPAAARQKSNNVEADYTGLPADTIIGIDIAHSNGDRSWFIPFTDPKPVSAGDTISFAIGAIVAVVANAA